VLWSDVQEGPCFPLATSPAGVPLSITERKMCRRLSHSISPSALLRDTRATRRGLISFAEQFIWARISPDRPFCRLHRSARWDTL
jgi:hypothetical protein